MSISAGRNAREVPTVAASLEEVLTTFPYTDQARRWLRTAVEFTVEHLTRQKP